MGIPTIQGISTRVLAFFWEILPNHRDGQAQELELLLNTAKRAVWRIHPNEEVSEAILLLTARRLLASAQNGRRFRYWPETHQLPQELVSDLQLIVFELLDQTEEIQEQEWGLLENSRSHEQFNQRINPILLDGLLRQDFRKEGTFEARYIRFVVSQTTFGKNLDFVFMGVPRLVFRYTTSEIGYVTRFFDLNLGPGSKYGGNFYSVRRKLLDEIQNRFGSLILVTNDPGLKNEKCFWGQRVEDLRESGRSENLTKFTLGCLKDFANWEIGFKVGKENTEPEKTIQRILQSFRQENETAKAVGFILTHPDTLENIVKQTLPFEKAEKLLPGYLPCDRLALPKVQLRDEPTTHRLQGGSSEPHLPLTQGQQMAPGNTDLKKILQEVDEDKRRRSVFRQGVVYIQSGFKVLQVIYPGTNYQNPIPLPQEDCLIEFWGSVEGQDFPLFVFPIRLAEFESIKTRSFREKLPSGFQVEFTLSVMDSETEKFLFQLLTLGEKEDPSAHRYKQLLSVFAWCFLGVLFLGIGFTVWFLLGSQVVAPHQVEAPTQKQPPNDPRTPAPPPVTNAPKSTAPEKALKLALNFGGRDIETQFSKELRAGLDTRKWRVKPSESGQTKVLTGETALSSGSEVSLLLELRLEDGSVFWSKTVVLTDSNVRTQAFITAQELNRLYPSLKRREVRKK